MITMIIVKYHMCIIKVLYTPVHQQIFIIIMESNLSQKIEILISGRNLKDLDFFSKSDPYVKVSFRRDFNAKSYIPIGRTQTINNDLNPNFQKTFTIDYIFESKQDIKFQVFDDDGGDDDMIGTVETTVSQLMGASNQTSIFDLKFNNKLAGKLVIRCQTIIQTSHYYGMKWRALKLMNTDSFFDFWDKSDPLLKFFKVREDNTLVEVGCTEVVQNNLNPDWRYLQISSTKLHTANNFRFKVQCWDWQADGKNQFIGECLVDAKEVMSRNIFPLEIQLVNPKASKPGKLVLEAFKQIKRPTFVEYLRGGLQLNMIVAIDFTGSNGMPMHPTSLHYMNPKSPNQYQTAITAISSIILNYDSDKRIPAFGFGAKPKYQNGINANVVSHCFPLSGNASELEVFGFEHLMQTYCHALKSLEFSGPTWFGPIIQQAMQLASVCKKEGSNVYQILLILTDGDIHDMRQTIDLIVSNCDLPISILIVGVGDADFSNMEKLDGDNGLFNDSGRKASRDIVQFVPFRDVKMNSDLLAKQLLAQLPGQVVQYMMLINKPPNQPKHVNIADVVPNINPMQNQKLLGMMEKLNLHAQQQNKGGQQPQKNPYQLP